MAQTKTAQETKNELKPKAEQNLAELYKLEPLEWDRVRVQIESEWRKQGPGEEAAYHVHWLATTRPDGRPHLMPFGASYSDGRFYIVSGAGTQKSKDLAANPHCSIGFAAKDLHVIVEGEARRVTDEAKLKRIAELYASAGWTPTVRDGAFWHEYSAPSAGPPPWNVYEFRPQTVFGLAAGDPPGATRWRVE